MSSVLQSTSKTPAEELGNLDRFQLSKILGEGAQGVVYLAFDPHLERQVAIKSLGSLIEHPPTNAPATSDMQMLLREARMVSKFQHPNIVSIYEIGFIGASPYLVLEFISGPLLSQIIKSHRNGTELEQAIRLITQVLDGLAYAHDHGIIHGDLKPANVLVTGTEVAKIADFGIARGIGEQYGEGLAGSPRYMAPEYVTDRVMTPAADQFAAGLIFYQLLTGKHPVTGKSMEVLFEQITAAEFPPPSSINVNIDPEIDAIVVRALSRDPAKRFAHVSDFKLALENYQAEQLTNLTLSSAPPKIDSLRTLRQRIRNQKDFPALSGSITNLNSLFGGDQKNASAIAAVIGKDLALTSKVMRIANSAYVPHAGGEITTLSHAVMMLGFSTIREIASSLLMIDLIPRDNKSSPVKEQLVRSLFSATLARKIAIRQGFKDVDGCYLVGMFYRFGKLLVCFHMPEQMEEISKRCGAGIREEEAALAVIGYSYTEIGHEIAADWSLPAFLVNSVQAITLQPDATAEPNIGAIYGALSNDVTDLLAASSIPAKLRSSLNHLRSSYQQLIDISSDEMEEILEGSRTEFQKYCAILKIDTSGSALMDCLMNWEDHFPEQVLSQGKEEVSHPDTTGATNQTGGQNSKGLTTLTRGIDDVNKLLDSDDYDFDGLIRKILATIYYGAGCHRVLLCRCIESQRRIKARYAVGKKVNNLLKQFQFPVDGTSGVFSRAVESGKDIIIGDLGAHTLHEPIPDWYKALEPANSFALLPFQSASQTRGFIYLDHSQAHYLDRLPAEQLALLRDLRDLAEKAYGMKREQTQQP